MSNSKEEPIVGLNPEEKEFLLSLARETIFSVLKEDKFPEVTPVSDRVQEELGVFVTLHKKGQLRGCIGYVEGYKPLYLAVMEMAKSAAFNDPRFPPVEISEIKELEIEISVLSPIKKITNIEEIQIGTHGLIIKRGITRGLLLPQVATEWKWDREEFLQQTCFKAGLPPDAWKKPETEIFIFSAEIFNENDILKK